MTIFFIYELAPSGVEKPNEILIYILKDDMLNKTIHTLLPIYVLI